MTTFTRTSFVNPTGNRINLSTSNVSVIALSPIDPDSAQLCVDTNTVATGVLTEIDTQTT